MSGDVTPVGLRLLLGLGLIAIAVEAIWLWARMSRLERRRRELAGALHAEMAAIQLEVSRRRALSTEMADCRKRLEPLIRLLTSPLFKAFVAGAWPGTRS